MVKVMVMAMEVNRSILDKEVVEVVEVVVMGGGTVSRYSFSAFLQRCIFPHLT